MRGESLVRLHLNGVDKEIDKNTLRNILIEEIVKVYFDVDSLEEALYIVGELYKEIKEIYPNVWIFE